MDELDERIGESRNFTTQANISQNTFFFLPKISEHKTPFVYPFATCSEAAHSVFLTRNNLIQFIQVPVSGFARESSRDNLSKGGNSYIMSVCTNTHNGILEFSTTQANSGTPGTEVQLLGSSSGMTLRNFFISVERLHFFFLFCLLLLLFSYNFQAQQHQTTQRNEEQQDFKFLITIKPQYNNYTNMTSEIHKLLSSSVRYSGSGDFSPDVLNFLVETVAAVVEDETAMNEDETLTMLLGK